ncbi:protein of unknown function [Streptomyces sp. KY75]|nr:protein of unknown function [Streptomyces sp. KY75]CAD5988859.1 protein of unknown function [Streptomyces sp. KY70]
MLRDTTITRRRPAETSNSSAPALLPACSSPHATRWTPGVTLCVRLPPEPRVPTCCESIQTDMGTREPVTRETLTISNCVTPPGDSIPQLGHIGAASETLWPHSRHPTIAIADPPRRIGPVGLDPYMVP